MSLCDITKWSLIHLRNTTAIAESIQSSSRVLDSVYPHDEERRKIISREFYDAARNIERDRAMLFAKVRRAMSELEEVRWHDLHEHDEVFPVALTSEDLRTQLNVTLHNSIDELHDKLACKWRATILERVQPVKVPANPRIDVRNSGPRELPYWIAKFPQVAFRRYPIPSVYEESDAAPVPIQNLPTQVGQACRYVTDAEEKLYRFRNEHPGVDRRLAKGRDHVWATAQDEQDSHDFVQYAVLARSLQDDRYTEAVITIAAAASVWGMATAHLHIVAWCKLEDDGVKLPADKLDERRCAFLRAVDSVQFKADVESRKLTMSVLAESGRPVANTAPSPPRQDIVVQVAVRFLKLKDELPTATIEDVAIQLGKEFDCSRSTVFGRLREARRRGLLPGKPGRPRELTNQMQRIDPLRSPNRQSA